MSRSGSGRRRTAQRNLLYEESSVWRVAAALTILACVLAVGIAVLMSGDLP
jgi:anti-sigma-K factor RskA